jgi:hypothetical protein
VKLLSRGDGKRKYFPSPVSASIVQFQLLARGMTAVGHEATGRLRMQSQFKLLAEGMATWSTKPPPSNNDESQLKLLDRRDDNRRSDTAGVEPKSTIATPSGGAQVCQLGS